MPNPVVSLPSVAINGRLASLQRERFAGSHHQPCRGRSTSSNCFDDETENLSTSYGVDHDSSSTSVSRRQFFGHCAVFAGAASAYTLTAGTLSASAKESSESQVELTERFESPSQGFTFAYPSNFVVAFDRTQRNNDGALLSVGNFTKFITVTVFSQQENVDLGNEFNTNFGYDLCVKPVVESPTTIGFTLLSERMSEDPERHEPLYDFEYEHSICRGEKIESAGGILRCIGNFGQDIPIQKKQVIGRAFLSRGRLLTIMASVNVDSRSKLGERDTLKAIVESFFPILSQ
jgi:hypothetical protein